eukprot:GDKJ01019785.1.p1 GENE.GDKJ01019785.1~~GDKJ01019785.1.p1  ORF type:complete len:142 (-),score=7.05 GDKJ01019785.1:52-477(-)
MAQAFHRAELMEMEKQIEVMIVDDSLIDQMITTKVLKSNGIKNNIVVMNDATEALNYIETNQHEPSLMPSFIFLDIDMPVLNGFGFLYRFMNFSAETKAAIKVVVLTASQNELDRDMMETHPNVYKLIHKPLNAVKLDGIL